MSGNDTLKDHAVADTISGSVNEKEKILYVLGKKGKSGECKIMGEMKAPADQKKN